MNPTNNDQPASFPPKPQIKTPPIAVPSPAQNLFLEMDELKKQMNAIAEALKQQPQHPLEQELTAEDKSALLLQAQKEMYSLCIQLLNAINAGQRGMEEAEKGYENDTHVELFGRIRALSGGYRETMSEMKAYLTNIKDKCLSASNL